MQQPAATIPNSKVSAKVKFYNFVYLTAGEYEKLIKESDEGVVKRTIEQLNDYMGSTGKKYASHYYTIKKWIASDKYKNLKVNTPTCNKPPPNKYDNLKYFDNKNKIKEE